MSCFRLPKTVTANITSAISQFWWGSSGNKKGMHWIAWKKLCRTKIDGGLGFRILDDFNTALLAKQLWRLIDAPDSLFAKVFKGRYYRNTDPLDPIRVYSPSYGWNSIISARSLIKRGLIKRVGSGTTVSVWSDPWIPADMPRPAMGPGKYFHPSITVNQLLDHTTRAWNVPLLQQLFDPSDVILIRGIPIPRFPKSDVYGWHFSKSGKYSVRSAYKLEYDRIFKETMPPVFGPDVCTLQAHAWKVRCPPKLKHFLWQAISGCLAVSANLDRRGIRCDTTCVRCGDAVETIGHVLFECPPAFQTWALSRIPSAMSRFPLPSVFANFDHLFWRIPLDSQYNEYPWILWYIWKARNDKVFSNIDRSPQDVLKLAENEALAWEMAQEADNALVGGINIPQDGLPPLRGARCFVDGSWKDIDVFSGLGWFCSKEDTEDVIMGARNIPRTMSPLHSEMAALLWAMRCMLTQQRTSVTFLTDSTDLVTMTMNPFDWPAFSTDLEEFATLRAEFSSLRVIFVPRAFNVKADSLARGVRLLRQNMFYVHSVPPVWLPEPF